LNGVQSNRNGIGSWIEVSVNGELMYRYTICGEGFLGQNSAYELFGVGTATTIDYVKVNWLSGVEDVITNVTPNQVLEIQEGETLSVAEEQFNGITISPNPTSGIINFNNVNSEYAVQVFDQLGRLVLTKNISNTDNSLDLSNESKGVYMLTLFNDSSSVTKKIVLK
ncbi:MAG: ASPIC/UnbV domain-containing protein, partial [Psychroserpens sp.]|nr:ASPIC/UnbV domain-containing protein [Psychroserpens sp.]